MIKFDPDSDSYIFVCDVCKKSIKNTRNALLFWNDNTAIIAHLFRCDPGKARYSASWPLNDVLEQLYRHYK